MIRIAPLGDPVEIRVRGINLSLRKNEVAALRIDRQDSERSNQSEDLADEEVTVTVAVIGNPNCGKTTLFNGLTGARQHVGNWAEVTVEQKTGQYRYDDKVIKVVDLPGIYSLDVNHVTTSLDEKVARDYILSQQADLIINIVDTSHLEHNLHLTTQLLEMRLPMLIVLNNMDYATGRDIEIDSDEIARRLDCLLVSLVASCAGEVKSIKSTINRLAETKPLSNSPVEYPAKVQKVIEQLVPLIEKQFDEKTMDSYWFAVKLLERDGYATDLADEMLNGTVNQHRQNIEDATNEEADILIADSRYGFINSRTEATVTQKSEVGRKLSDNIDRVILNRFIAIPIFFAVMYLMFTFTIKLGRAFKPFFNDLAQTIFVDGIGYSLGAMDSPQWVISLLAGGWVGLFL